MVVKKKKELRSVKAKKMEGGALGRKMHEGEKM